MTSSAIFRFALAGALCAGLLFTALDADAAAVAAPGPAPAPSSSGNQAPPASGPNMTLGQKIDVLTLSDLQDKLQATPDAATMFTSRLAVINLIRQMSEKIESVGPLMATPVGSGDGKE